MALQAVQPYQEAFLADIGFGYDDEAPPSWAALWQEQDSPVVTSPEEDTSSAGSGGTVASASGAGDDDGRGGGDRDRHAGDDGQRDRGAGDDGGGDRDNDDDAEMRRRLRRKLSNRESARRSRARKQRHLDEQRAAVAVLRAGNRDLAARLQGARARNMLVELDNAQLRAEGAALARRLAAARRALALMRLYYASSTSSPEAAWTTCRRSSLDEDFC